MNFISKRTFKRRILKKVKEIDSQINIFVDENEIEKNEQPIFPLILNSEPVSCASVNNSIDRDRLEIENYNVANAKTSSLRQDLRDWALKNNITHNALHELLVVLKKQEKIGELPIDPRSLLKTSKKIETISVPPGEYWHFGVRKVVEKIYYSLRHKAPIDINLNISIDGLPVSKSSNAQFWPILVNCNESYIDPLVVGIYYGLSKPLDANIYLSLFVKEMKQILSSDFSIDGKLIKIKIRSFICDAPARAFIKGIVGHNGYFACERCLVEGEYFTSCGHVCLKDMNSVARTDRSFRNKEQEEHHKFVTIIEELPIDIIKCFPLDYLHLILLGIMKRLLKIWLKGSANFGVKFSARDIKLISDRLDTAKHNQPHDINRAIRGLDSIHFWKATEFRTFLLKTGPVVLQDILPLEAFNHFLTLHCAVTICCTRNLLIYKEIARELFKEFCIRYTEIYGEDSITYNIHSLIHVIDDIENFGVFDSFSAFPFETKLHSIKRLLRTGNKPLQQAAKRLLELQQVDIGNYTEQQICPVLLKPKHGIFKHSLIVYAEIHLKHIALNSGNSDKWILTNALEIIEIKYFFERGHQIYIFGSSLPKSFYKDLYNLPIKSRNINIYKTIIHKKEPVEICIEEIFCKLFCIPINTNESAFIPLCHTFSHN